MFVFCIAAILIGCLGYVPWAAVAVHQKSGEFYDLKLSSVAYSDPDPHHFGKLDLASDSNAGSGFASKSKFRSCKFLK